jgi:hypothetical protein
MIPIINLNNTVEKELEHPSIRRARRWIYDANQNVYESWYPTKSNPIARFENNMDKGSGISKIKSQRAEPFNSILTRLSSLFNTRRREPVSSKS